MSLRTKPKRDANDLGAARFGKKTPGAYEHVDPFIRYRQRQNQASQTALPTKGPTPYTASETRSSRAQTEADRTSTAWVADRGGLTTGGAAAILDDISNDSFKAQGEECDVSLTTPTISIMNQCRVVVTPVMDSTSIKDKNKVTENKLTPRKAKSAGKVIDVETTAVPAVKSAAPKMFKAETTCISPVAKPTVTIDIFSPEAVERKMKSLLNKLTERTFESISNQVMQYINRSSEEQEGETMKLVIKLVCDKAVEDQFWARLYAQLCERIWKGIDKGVHVSSVDDPLHGLEGENLFRHCLLKHCQREFLDGLEQRAEKSSGEVDCSDQSVPAQPGNGKDTEAVKRKAKGLIKFMGELYNVGMLGTSAILPVFTLLIDKGSSDAMIEFEIKLACGLLTTISVELLRREALLPRRDKIENIANQASIELLDVPKSGTNVKTVATKKDSTVLPSNTDTPLPNFIKRKITFTDPQVGLQNITIGKQITLEPVSTLSVPVPPASQEQLCPPIIASSPPSPSLVQELVPAPECDVSSAGPVQSPNPTLELDPEMLSDINRVLSTTCADKANQCGQQLIERINECASSEAGQALESILLYVFEDVKTTGCAYLQSTGRMFPASDDNATQAAIMIKSIWSHATSHIQLKGFTSSSRSHVRGGKFCRELVATMMRDEIAIVWEDCGMRGDQPRTGISEAGRVILDFAVKLFLEDQLSPKVIYECLRRLLNNVSSPLESDVDQLCRILARTGAKLDRLNSGALAVYVTRFEMLRRSAISKIAKTKVEVYLDLP
ncbi:hypothetical protein QFC24_003711 [Naganishia onofrii]|uniref:Uncharacterized protein n=1 Tax=Naganishia onofrii TaxID=1851511 RepID=A0ACC2XLB2_9TREE|nr:hypothetical protein QFC24_003711 [Naganishia onofrii]